MFDTYEYDNPNPLVQARLQEGFSQDRLARKFGMSKQYISRAELGTYAGLNKVVAKWAAEMLGVSIRETDRLYRAFQQEKRLVTFERLQPKLLSRGTSTEPGHVIFKRWRQSYWSSPHSFSVDMCVHPSSVENYEDNIQPAMPELVRLALNELKLLDWNWTEEARDPGALRANLRPEPATTGLTSLGGG